MLFRRSIRRRPGVGSGPAGVGARPRPRHERRPYGDPGKASRSIDVICTDNAFSLKSLQVRDGETVRFVVRNEASIRTSSSSARSPSMPSTAR